MGETGLKECPKCGKKKAKRMLGAGAGLIFKGSGFYTTDYKRTGGDKDKDKDHGSGAKDSEKKPAAKESKDKEKKKEEKEPKK